MTLKHRIRGCSWAHEAMKRELLGARGAKTDGCVRKRFLRTLQEATRTAEMGVRVAVGSFLTGLSQPADSQGSGIANSDQPQSRQTLTSGDGVTGGWLRVRGEFRYKRISPVIVITSDGSICALSPSHSSRPISTDMSAPRPLPELIGNLPEG